MCGASGPYQTVNGNLGAETQLMQPTSSRSHNSHRQHCSNGHMFDKECAVRLGTLAIKLEKEQPDEACFGGRLLVRVGTFCLQSGLVACENPQCVSQVDLLRQHLPRCNWTNFREWIITAIACWLSVRATNGKFVELGGLLDPNIFTTAFQRLGDIQVDTAAAEPCLDIAGVLSLQHWTILAVFDSFGAWNDWAAEFAHATRQVYQPYMTQRIRHCRRALQFQEFGICPSRLGNLVLSSGNHPMTLIAILQGLNQSSIPRSGTKHSSCTEQLCMFAEDNATNFAQLHKCSGVSGGPPSSKCRQTVFSPDNLRKLLSKNLWNPWVCTAWDVSKWAKYSIGKTPPSNTLFLGQPSCRYIAISHVWSDGTGVGINSPGNVNSCLAAYFARIAVRLGCSGLWWDSICVPSGREEKRRAMDRMLDNYANATYTVIHDLSLVNLEWTDDGTPAIALTLSSWYTRGWTATELFSTRKAKGSVKVLFKDPNLNNTEPLIKDLDTEVLIPAENYSGLRWGRVPSHAHLSVSTIVRCIRHSETEAKIKSLSHLMRILRPRTTSWAKDRMILAALLCLPSDDVNTSRTISQLTTDILRRLRTFPMSYLFHGEAPISPFGAFSWCPPSLFDLGKATTLTAAHADSDVECLSFGVLECFVDAYLLSDARDALGILPYASHPSIVAKINVALTTPSNCVLLRRWGLSNDGEQTIDTWILANRVPQPSNHQLLSARIKPEQKLGLFLRWVGCVICRKPKYGKSSLFTRCFFGLDVDEQGRPLRTISPSG